MGDEIPHTLSAHQNPHCDCVGSAPEKTSDFFNSGRYAPDVQKDARGVRAFGLPLCFFYLGETHISYLNGDGSPTYPRISFADVGAPKP